MTDLQMPTLNFMPWCRLDREYRVGAVALIPYSREHPPVDLDPDHTRAVNTILADFIYVNGRPIDRCTLITLENRLLIEGWDNPNAFETTYGHAQMACLSSLEGRDYFGSAEPYSNAECFALYSRQYREGRAVAAPIFRRDSTPLGLAGPALRVHIPAQAIAVPKLPFNEPLYRALTALRRRWLDAGRTGDWAIWAESIYSFNLANTDQESFGRDLEWVLMCSAMQRLLGARSSAADTASKLAAALTSDGSLGPSASETVQDWAKEFYRLRNDFAHGKLRTRQPRMWHQPYHLLLAAIVFPLLVKKLLEREAFYQSTETDRVEVAAFVRFAADLRDTGSPRKSWHRYVREEQEQARVP